MQHLMGVIIFHFSLQPQYDTFDCVIHAGRPQSPPCRERQVIAKFLLQSEHLAPGWSQHHCTSSGILADEMLGLLVSPHTGSATPDEMRSSSKKIARAISRL